MDTLFVHMIQAVLQGEYTVYHCLSDMILPYPSSWHILGLACPLASLSLVGFYRQPTKSLTFSKRPKGCHVLITWMLPNTSKQKSPAT